MRPSTRLHGSHLLRLVQIANVEYADAPKTLWAHRRRNALGTAVEPPSSLLHRQEEQIAVDRHISLAAGTYHRCQETRLRSILDGVRVEAVEIADEEMVSAERDIRVREVQPGIRRWRRRRCSCRRDCRRIRPLWCRDRRVWVPVWRGPD